MSAPSIIRAISQFSGNPERYFNLEGMSWKKRTEFRDELVHQGWYIQDVMIDDPMQVQVAAELRRRQKEEDPA